MTAPPLVTQQHLEDVMRRLQALEKRVARTEVRERIDYAFNAYSPSYFGGATAGATTFTTQVGAWIQLGAVVIATGQLVWTAATGTGNARISLPIAAVGTAGLAWGGSASFVNVTFANSTPTVEVIASNSFFQLRSPLTNAAGALVQVEAAGTLLFTVAYFIA